MAKVTDWGATDGVRYAAFPTGKHGELMLEAHGRGQLRKRRIPLAKCPDGERPWDYVAGAGQLVGQCAYALVIQNLATGHFGEPPYVERPGGFFDFVFDGSEGDEVHATAIGSRWIRATVAQMSGSPTRYLDWHTGESADDPTSATEIGDVNSPVLVRQLCAPLQRIAIAPSRGTGFYPYFYNGSLGVTTTLGGPPGPYGQPGEEVTVQQCGQAVPHVLAACAGDCQDLQVGGGVVTWETREDVGAFPPQHGWLYAYSIAKRRLYRWSARPFEKPHNALARIAHAGRRVFVTSCTGVLPRRNCTVSTARLSR